MKKRILAILLCLILTAPAALAEPQTVDLDTMTLEEISDLRKQINRALWSMEEYAYVTVPAGAYQVGVEIPAGKWTVFCSAGDYAVINAVSALNETGTGRGKGAEVYFSQIVADNTSSMYEQVPVDSFTFTLTDGMFVVIERASVNFRKAVAPVFTFSK